MVTRIRRLVVAFRERQRGAMRAQSGQSLIILAFAFLGLIAMLGLALDLGLVYIERVRIKRAVDAATLAGVVELPFEEDAFARSIEYLSLNGYDIDPISGDADVYVMGCIEDPSRPGEFVDQTTPYPYIQVLNPRSVFTITAVPAPGTGRDPTFVCREDVKNFGNANRLSITGTVTVDMNFMQFFGFGEVPVMDWAVAQNVTDLDVVVVFDVSGSMEFSTICYDCWVRYNPSDPDYPNNGRANPLPASVPLSSLCTDQQVVDSLPHVEDGVVVGPDVGDRLIEGDVQHVLSAQQVVERHAHQERGLADARSGENQSDVALSEPPVESLLEKPQRASGREKFPVHQDPLRIGVSRPCASPRSARSGPWRPRPAPARTWRTPA